MHSLHFRRGVSEDLNLRETLCVQTFSLPSYHNYHHVFPWDYRAAEVGDMKHFNVSTVLLDICAYFGLVYDRKIVTQSMIDRRMARTGDGTHYLEDLTKEKLVWGYGDVDMDIDDRMDLHAFEGDSNNNSKNGIKTD
jgi:stearoyl-CoA desaturase (delta-9 desaturase)